MSTALLPWKSWIYRITWYSWCAVIGLVVTWLQYRGVFLFVLSPFMESMLIWIVLWTGLAVLVNRNAITTWCDQLLERWRTPAARRRVRGALWLTIIISIALALWTIFVSSTLPLWLSLVTALPVICVVLLIVLLSPAARGRLLTNLERVTSSRVAGWEWLVCGAVLLLAIGLRLVHLSALPPYTDEYFHLVAAKQLFDGSAGLTDVYQRGLLTVTLPIRASFELFGASVWAARLPMVLLHSVAIIPLYWLLRRLGRSVAVIGVLLFATNPWLIAITRLTREYAVYPGIYFLIALGVWSWLELIPAQWQLRRDLLRLLRHPRFILLSIALCLPLVYALVIDPLSTLKNCVILYGVAGLFAVGRYDWSSARLRRFVVTSAAILMLVIGTALIWQDALATLLPNWSAFWVGLLARPALQWGDWLRLPFMMSVVGLLGVVIWFGRTTWPRLVLAWWAVAMYAYSLHFTRYNRPRYGIIIEYLTIPVLALALAWLWVVLKQTLPRQWSRVARGVLAGGVLLVLIWHPQGTWRAISAAETDRYTTITDEYHDTVDATYQYLLQQARPGDVLLATILDSYYNFKRTPGTDQFAAVIHFSYTEPDFDTVLAQHPRGWFVIDDRRRQWIGLEPATFTTPSGHTIEFVKQIDQQYVYRWGD